MWKRACVICLLSVPALVSVPALAQRMGGGRPQGGPPPTPPSTAEEKQRAANAAEFADMIEKARASVSPPPLPQIRFPSENEKALSRLRLVEDQHKELRQYLDKLWKDNKDAPAQRVAFETLWRDAEKPKWMPRWVRPAIEDYYKQQSKGLALFPPKSETKPEIAKPEK
jgi:hypothetical protein